MPRVEELLEQLGSTSARFITTLDLTKDYPYTQMIERREKTAFMCPMGKFKFVRMPFGLKGAPTTFQRLMDVVLGPCASFARAYIDDNSSTWSDHLRHLDIHQTEGGWTEGQGHQMFHCHGPLFLPRTHCGGGKIEMEEAKVAALKDYKRPVTKRDVRAFLGLAGYKV